MASLRGASFYFYRSYAENFCLYRISMTSQVTDAQEFDAPTLIEAREPCPSLDAHLKFSSNPTTNLAFVCMFIFSDSMELRKDQASDRSILLNYPL